MKQRLEEDAEELYENAPCGYLSTRPDGTISRVNQTFLNWTGYTRRTLLAGKRFSELLTSPGRIVHETHYAPLLQMQGFVNEIAFELRCANRDEPLPVLVDSVQVHDENGRPLLIRTTIFNATDRRQYEQELQRTRRQAAALTSSLDVQRVMEQILAYQEKVDAILHNSVDGLLLVDVNLCIQQANQAFQRLFGYTDNEYRGHSVLAIVPSPAVAQLRAKFQAAQRAASTPSTELYARRKAGDLFAAELTIGPTKDGGFVCTIRDITERKQAEAALHEQRDLLQLVIDNVPDLIMVKDRAGRFQLVNTQAAQRYGMKPADMVGKTDADLNPHTAQVAFYRQKDQEALDSGQPIFIPEEAILDRYYQTSKIPLRAAQGQPNHLLIVAFDITHRKNTELALQQALQKEKELGELKSRFISMASHEFRTPLAVVRATADTLLLYRHKLSVEQIDKRLTRIQDQVSHLTGIIEDVLHLTRLQARRIEYTPVSFDLEELGRTIIEEVSDQFGNDRVVYHCDTALRTVTLDPKLMRQILTNLISNALKYSDTEQLVAVDLTAQPGALTLQVRDQGIGIPAADLPHLYEPFHRAANVGVIAGTGLGLIITKECVELQGGTIEITSQPGFGTTCTVWLPNF